MRCYRAFRTADWPAVSFNAERVENRIVKMNFFKFLVHALGIHRGELTSILPVELVVSEVALGGLGTFEFRAIQIESLAGRLVHRHCRFHNVHSTSYNHGLVLR